MTPQENFNAAILKYSKIEILSSWNPLTDKWSYVKNPAIFTEDILKKLRANGNTHVRLRYTTKSGNTFCESRFISEFIQTNFNY